MELQSWRVKTNGLGNIRYMRRRLALLGALRNTIGNTVAGYHQAQGPFGRIWRIPGWQEPDSGMQERSLFNHQIMVLSSNSKPADKLLTATAGLESYAARTLLADRPYRIPTITQPHHALRKYSAVAVGAFTGIPMPDTATGALMASGFSAKAAAFAAQIHERITAIAPWMAVFEVCSGRCGGHHVRQREQNQRPVA